MTDWIALDREVHLSTYARLPVVLERAEGTRLWDINGQEYVDFLAGLGAVNLGHARPEVIEAVSNQARQLDHVSNLFYSPVQLELAARLAQLVGGRCFFANSGAEANEGALKLARRWGIKNFGAKKSGFITALGSFHGRTLATLTATGQPAKSALFAPLPTGFKHVPFNDLPAMEAALDETVCAVMLELIQGEGGVWPAKADYLAGVRQLCDERQVLLIFDEVQTGMGRTGPFLASEQAAVEPDITTLAKSLANGFPIGALVAKPTVADAFEPGDHGSTFGGGSPICAGALAVLDIMDSAGLKEQVAALGAYFCKQLTKLGTETGQLKDVRGAGLMIGVTTAQTNARAITLALLEQGFVINNIGDDCLRFLPPLVITEAEIDALLTALGKELMNYAN